MKKNTCKGFTKRGKGCRKKTSGDYCALHKPKKTSQPKKIKPRELTKEDVPEDFPLELCPHITKNAPDLQTFGVLLLTAKCFAALTLEEFDSVRKRFLIVKRYGEEDVEYGHCNSIITDVSFLGKLPHGPRITYTKVFSKRFSRSAHKNGPYTLMIATSSMWVMGKRHGEERIYDGKGTCVTFSRYHQGDCHYRVGIVTWRAKRIVNFYHLTEPYSIHTWDGPILEMEADTLTDEMLSSLGFKVSVDNFSDATSLRQFIQF
jgi:hypothetical protein